jgi:hypothetical protein
MALSHGLLSRNRPTALWSLPQNQSLRHQTGVVVYPFHCEKYVMRRKSVQPELLHKPPIVTVPSTWPRITLPPGETTRSKRSCARRRAV